MSPSETIKKQQEIIKQLIDLCKRLEKENEQLKDKVLAFYGK